MSTPDRDMMTDSPAHALRREIRAHFEAHDCGAWTAGETGAAGAVMLQHPFRPQGRVFSLAEALAHIARHA